jgi:hypothetical protein
MNTSRITIFSGLAIPLFALIYLLIDLTIVANVPKPDELKAAADHIRKDWKTGDLVVFSPQWAQGASPWLQGLKVDTGENSDWYEALKYERVWVIGSTCQRSHERGQNLKNVDTRAFGNVFVDLLEPVGDSKLVYSFRENIGDAVVTKLSPKRRELCSTLKDGRWYCGRVHPWLFVGKESKDTGGKVRDLIWAHAVDKATIEVAYPKVPAGKTMTVHYGLTQRAYEAREGAPVTFKIVRNNVTLFEEVLAPDRAGWFRKDFPMPEDKESEIRFLVSTPNAQSRQMCFTADIWK